MKGLRLIVISFRRTGMLSAALIYSQGFVPVPAWHKMPTQNHWIGRQMALLQANKDLISKGIREFNALLDQQVFTEPPVSEEAMVTIVDDWVQFYVNYYKQQMTGEQGEQERALAELRQELHTLSVPFLDKYRAFLKSL